MYPVNFVKILGTHFSEYFEHSLISQYDTVFTKSNETRIYCVTLCKIKHSFTDSYYIFKIRNLQKNAVKFFSTGNIPLNFYLKFYTFLIFIPSKQCHCFFLSIIEKNRICGSHITAEKSRILYTIQLN